MDDPEPVAPAAQPLGMAPGRRVAAVIRRGVVAVLLAALAVELGLALWFRVSSLGGMPIFGADEAFYGIQARRLAQGRPFLFHTVTGNIADPFLILPQVPLHLVFGPEPWIPALPVAASGIAASILAFVLLRGVLDPTTALAAAVLHACLPAAIVFARFGCEFGQTPLVGVIAASFALRGKVGWLLLTCAAGFLVHPTNVFLALILGPVVVARLAVAEGGPRDVACRLRSVAWLVTGAAAAGAWLLSRASVRAVLRQGIAGLGEADWALFLDNFTIMMAQGPPLPGGFGTRTPLFAALGGAMMGVGLVALTLRRQWKRAALLVGLALGLIALHVVGGTHVLLGASRYGAVLITPAVLVAACLIRELVPGPDPGRPAAGVLRLGVLVGVCGLMLCAAHRNFFLPGAVGSEESIWTFRAEEPGPARRILEVLRRDLAEEPAGASSGRRLILAQDYFVATPLAYLLDDRAPRLRVVQLVSIPELGEFVLGRDPMGARLPRIAGRLAAGDYAIRSDSAAPRASEFIERVIAERFEPGRVRTWSIPHSAGVRIFRVGPEPAAGRLAAGVSERGATTR